MDWRQLTRFATGEDLNPKAFAAGYPRELKSHERIPDSLPQTRFVRRGRAATQRA